MSEALERAKQEALTSVGQNEEYRKAVNAAYDEAMRYEDADVLADVVRDTSNLVLSASGMPAFQVVDGMAALARDAVERAALSLGMALKEERAE